MIKQVIIIRKDLRMRRGKEIAQGAHASMKWLVDRMRAQEEAGWDNPKISKEEYEWLFGPFTKICLQVESEMDLLALERRAHEDGLTVALIEDSGRTEFGGVPTKTALAIGPSASEAIDRITGHLAIY